MVIDIPDTLPGEERRRMLRFLPILYAYENFDRQEDIADFLGVDERTIRYHLKKYEELHHLIKVNKDGRRKVPRPVSSFFSGQANGSDTELRPTEEGTIS